MFRTMPLPMRSMAVAMLAAQLVPSGPRHAGAQDAAAAGITALVAAYPDHLAGREGNDLIWRDGTRMTIDDGRAKSHEQKLDDADIEDMMSQAYPVGRCSYAAPERNSDPGRIRSEALFRKMYGASRTEAKRNLTTIRWFGARLEVTRINGVDTRLEAVVRDLATLPGKLLVYVNKGGGSFNWRPIAGTARLSVHSFGAAIDINTKYADYWRWRGGKPGDVRTYRNRIPREVVEVFERHGFIWGGKWYHYDTMHFEYRPEIIGAGRRTDDGPGCMPAR